MELIVKVAVLSLVSVVLALVLSEKTPQFAICVVLIATIIVLGMCFDYAKIVIENLQDLIENSGLNISIFEPVIKVCGISVIAKITGDICKDAGFSALTQKIQFVASITSIIVIFPLFEMIIEVLKDII